MCVASSSTQRGLASGVEWVDSAGREHACDASVVVCAANGVGTPRLLLASACASFPDGLANRSGLVGRGLMLHPFTGVAGYFDEDLESWQGNLASAVQSLEFYETSEERGYVGGCKWSLSPTGGPLGVALDQARDGVLGTALLGAFRDRFGRGARWGLMCEDLRDDDNRVELSPTIVDASGLRRPRSTTGWATTRVASPRGRPHVRPSPCSRQVRS